MCSLLPLQVTTHSHTFQGTEARGLETVLPTLVEIETAEGMTEIQPQRRAGLEKMEFEVKQREIRAWELKDRSEETEVEIS
jgi:hypothetical protein